MQSIKLYYIFYFIFFNMSIATVLKNISSVVNAFLGRRIIILIRRLCILELLLSDKQETIIVQMQYLRSRI